MLITHAASAQSGVCYFQKDTGTADTEISNSVVELSDGTLYVTGSQANGPFGLNDVALLKYDACGNLLWIKYYGDSLANDAFYINKTADEKLLIAGQTATPANNTDAAFYLLDSSGNVIWLKTYGASLDQMVRYVEQTADKGFILCGYASDSFGSNDSYVLKTDSAGNKQWDLVYGGPSVEYADMVRELPDGNFVVSGDTKSSGAGATDVEMVKCDKNGNIIWDKFYGDNLDNGCQGVKILSNGNYLSYGETNIPGNVAFDFFIETIDTAGNSISKHTFGGSAADALFDIVEMPGMDFMCTGYSRSFNGFAAYDIVLFRVDSAGNMKWLKNIYSPGIDIGYKLIPSLYGDYVMTGLYDVNNGNYFLMRSDTIANTNVAVAGWHVNAEPEVYPNPACDRLRISAGTGETCEIIFLNALGEEVANFTLGPGANDLSVAGIPAGAYTLVSCAGGERKFVKKLFINH
jgi:hypothetical protein